MDPPTVLQLVTDSLRYWPITLNADSRFTLATAFMLHFPNRTLAFGLRRMFLTQPAASRRSGKR
jgi:pullulanase/glycogen debranching enzyme